jgi:anti-sigma regulatory factor (Ser/Thr protein kinase)
VALRRQLRSFLGACRLPAADLEDLVLAACEAATNGIEHARYPSEPFFDVQAEIDDTLVRVVVRDYGRWTPGGPDGAGLGLHLMTGLTAVSVTSGPGGTSVTLSAVVDGGQR